MPQVVLIGCVDRAAPIPGTPTAFYHLTDVQPGGTSPTARRGGGAPPPTATPSAPMMHDARYRLAGPASIDFAKYQNQRVEVTGAITEDPTVARGQMSPASGQTPPLSTLTITALRVLSTECKRS